MAACVGTYACGLAGEDLSVVASGPLVSGGVQEAGMGGVSRADPGPADSAVAAGSDESAVGSELGSLVRKVGSALVSGSPEPMNQIQAYGEEKKKIRFLSGDSSSGSSTSTSTSTSTNRFASGAACTNTRPAPAPVPVPAPAQIHAGDLAPARASEGRSRSQHSVHTQYHQQQLSSSSSSSNNNSN